MKRSESVLVYGVTGVLAVILAIAIVFGGDPAEGNTDLSVAGLTPEGGGTLDLTDDDVETPPTTTPTSDDLLNELLGTGAGIEDENEPLESEADSETESAPVSVPTVPLSRTVATLGTSRTEENPASGERFRFVNAQPGDSIALLIQRWCPGTERMDIEALNETKNLDRLRIGDEICVPWVDDETLLEAHEARQAMRTADAGGATFEPSSGSGATPVSTTGAREYVIKDGESLWVIATREVGANKAQQFIDDVVALNPSIQDPSRVRAKMKILLPRR